MRFYIFYIYIYGIFFFYQCVNILNIYIFSFLYSSLKILSITHDLTLLKDELSKILQKFKVLQKLFSVSGIKIGYTEKFFTWRDGDCETTSCQKLFVVGRKRTGITIWEKWRGIANAYLALVGGELVRYSLRVNWDARYSRMVDRILNIASGYDRDLMAVTQNLKRAECQAHAHKSAVLPISHVYEGAKSPFRNYHFAWEIYYVYLFFMINKFILL